MKNPNPAKINETAATRTCGGAEIVGSISDLLLQIFVHLPLKPLFRFKTVSKQWNSIISDQRFQYMHVKEHSNRAAGLIFQKFCHMNDPPPVETRVVSFEDRSSSSNPLPQIIFLPDRTLRIFHSCNGLLVLKSTADEEKYYVYNPTTNQITAPLLKDYDAYIKSREGYRVVGMYLAFDPSKSPHHYKVVCVWMLGWFDLRSVKHQFEVYSSETGSWETRGLYNTDTLFLNFYDVVYWNGAIHWFNSNGDSIILNVDDHDGKPGVLPKAPTHHHDNSRGYCFGESCGHLHCAVLVGGDGLLPGIYVYEMRRDYSEWFFKFRVDHNSQCFVRNIHTVPKIYSVVRGKKDEDSALVLGNDEGEIICYNLAHNTCRTIHDKDYFFQRNAFCGYITNSFQFAESPCSV